MEEQKLENPSVCLDLSGAGICGYLPTSGLHHFGYSVILCLFCSYNYLQIFFFLIYIFVSQSLLTYNILVSGLAH